MMTSEIDENDLINTGFSTVNLPKPHAANEVITQQSDLAKMLASEPIQKSKPINRSAKTAKQREIDRIDAENKKEFLEYRQTMKDALAQMKDKKVKQVQVNFRMAEKSHQMLKLECVKSGMGIGETLKFEANYLRLKMNKPLLY